MESVEELLSESEEKEWTLRKMDKKIDFNNPKTKEILTRLGKTIDYELSEIHKNIQYETSGMQIE